MSEFKDKETRTWTVAIDVYQLKAVRERCKFELGKILADDMAGLKRLASDPELLVDVLFVLCGEEAERLKVSPESFGRALRGDVIEAGWDALMEAYADFCPSRQRKALRALLAKSQELSEAAMVKTMKSIEGLDPQVILNGSAGSAAASVESTQTPLG